MTHETQATGLDRRAALRMLASMAAAGAAPSTFAQARLPRTTGRLVVPFPPGGPSDTLARIVADGLQKQLGATFVVDNKPGATGNIGAAEAARAAPDGMTLLITNTSLVMNPFLFTKTKVVDPFKELSAVSALGTTTFAFVVNTAATPETSLKDWAERMRRKTQVSYGSFGVGSTNHLYAHDLGAKLQLPFLHVPYKGDAPAVQDLLGGQIDCAFFSIVSASRAGDRLKALAVTGEERSAQFPNVPTLKELGIAGFEQGGWLGLLAPAGTPVETRRLIAKATTDTLATPEAREKLAASGITLFGTTPERFDDMIRSESVRLAARIKASGATLD